MTDEQTGFEFTDADLEILGASDHRPDAYWDDDLEKWVLRLSRINICTRLAVLPGPVLRVQLLADSKQADDPGRVIQPQPCRHDISVVLERVRLVERTALT